MYLRKLKECLPLIGGVDIAVNQDKPVKKFIKLMHNHPRTAAGKRIVSKTEIKRRKRKMAKASKQKNRRYA